LPLSKNCQGGDFLQKKIKLAATAVLVVAVLAVSIGYALLTATYTFQNTMSIKGVGVTVLEWIDDTTPPTQEVTTHDWGTAAAGETVYYAFVCVRNTGTEYLTLSFSKTLNAAVGTIRWEIEQMDTSEVWHWHDWASEIASNGILGSSSNPMESGQILGMRPEVNAPGNLGHIRIVIEVAADAPQGEVTPFDTTITGTEST
jgi:hypothetical protein